MGEAHALEEVRQAELHPAALTSTALHEQIKSLAKKRKWHRKLEEEET